MAFQRATTHKQIHMISKIIKISWWSLNGSLKYCFSRPTGEELTNTQLPKTEPNKMSFESWMYKQIVVHPYSGALSSNKKKHYQATKRHGENLNAY